MVIDETDSSSESESDGDDGEDDESVDANDDCREELVEPVRPQPQRWAIRDNEPMDRGVVIEEVNEEEEEIQKQAKPKTVNPIPPFITLRQFSYWDVDKKQYQVLVHGAMTVSQDGRNIS